jgi:hypothetical protein
MKQTLLAWKEFYLHSRGTKHDRHGKTRATAVEQAVDRRDPENEDWVSVWGGYYKVRDMISYRFSLYNTQMYMHI